MMRRIKPITKILCCCITFIICTSFISTDEYDVRGFYSAVETESGTKAITSDGEINEITHVLVPTKLKEGKYAISVTRKAKDLYKVDDKDIYIETRFCFEYASSQDVILIIESNSGYTKGKIIF